MTRFETPRVAIVGAGQVGRGWAALTVAAGWPVTIYDADSETLAPAADAIGDRVLELVRLKRAEAQVAEDSLNLMRVGRSLLQAVEAADWVIEAVPDDLTVKQKALQLIEQVARRAAIITSSASSLSASTLAARLERPDRFLVAHPLHPVELMPLVELVPGPHTDETCTEDIRFWLSLLGRSAVVLRKEIPGNVAGRLNAAIWRECIQLVLDGVLDVEDIDRAVSIGPALIWASSGVHLSQHLEGGPGTIEMYLSHLLNNQEAIWATLAEWKKLDPEDQKRLTRLLDKAYTSHVTGLRQAKDQRLVRLLDAVRE
jgi:3-hydroxyacyl-CoA dehydrogenase